MEKEKDEVLWQNEISANKLQAVGLLVAVGVFFVVLIFVEMEIFYVYRWDKNTINMTLALIELLMIAGVVLGLRVKFAKKWLKYVLMIDLLLAFGMLDMIFTYTTSILIVIPIILSSRYFSSKFTIGVSAVTVVVFFISSMLGAFYGIYDVNNLQLEPGTVINMGNEIWIADVIDTGGITVDTGLMLKNVLIYGFFPELLETIIAAVVCVTIAYHGKRMVLKQKTLTEKTARLGTELELATKIQADMLPSIFPAFPEREEFELYASMNPAKEVGGDFYDFFMLDDDHLYMAIADVSGKGVPAALFMMASRILLADHVKMGKSPAEVLRDVNNAISETNDNHMFVTVWLGILELSTGKLTAANAGHEYPVIKKPDGGFELYKDKHGIVVGGLQNAKYREYEIQLEPGSRLFVYTDGVPEATDKDNNQFGTERMTEVLNKLTEAKPDELLKGVRKSVDEFVMGAEQFDDITMLCLDYRGKK